MNVLQIHNLYRFSGGEDAVVDNEMKLLTEYGLNVKQLHFDNKQINAGRLFFNKQAYSRTREAIREFQPHVVHAHNLFYQASPAVLKAAKDLGVPIVMTLHNFRLICPAALLLRDGQICTKCVNLKFPAHGVYHACFQDSVPKSLLLSTFLWYSKVQGIWKDSVDRFIVLTPFIKDLFIQSSLGVGGEKLIVKPNSTDDIYEDTEKVPPARQGFLYIGRLSREKGVHLLLEAFQGLPEKSLTIVGTGPLEQELRDLAGKNIHFRGEQPRSSVAELLRTTKALVFPSLCYEGLPNTIIESYAAGTPVIACDNENISKLVNHNYNGLLFSSGQVKSLIQAIEDYDMVPREDFEKCARRTYLEKYTHKINLENLLEIYNSVVN